jgi:DNA-directed RNA polymerase subunit RPC12/RpoP
LIHGTVYVACRHCTFRTKSAKYLKKHVATQHVTRQQQQHACADCGAAWESGAALARHRTAAHPDRRRLLACPDCDYRTDRRFNLAKHVSGVHEGVRHACAQCDAAFRHVGSLRAHEQSAHLGALYPCTECGKVYRNAKTLSRHQSLVHFGGGARTEDDPTVGAKKVILRIRDLLFFIRWSSPRQLKIVQTNSVVELFRQ